MTYSKNGQLLSQQLSKSEVYKLLNQPQILVQRSVCGVMNKMLKFGLEVSEFELQLYYYIHFWTNILGKGMNPLVSPPPQLWVKWYHCCSSSRIALALNNPQRFMSLNKKQTRLINGKSEWSHFHQ